MSELRFEIFKTPARVLRETALIVTAHVRAAASIRGAGAREPSGELEPSMPGVQGKVLFESSFVRFDAWRCSNPHPTISRERHLTSHAMAFPDRVPFLLHGSRGAVLAGRNEVSLHNAFSSFRTSHPFGCGDTGHLLTIRPDVLFEILGRYDSAAADKPGEPFPARVAPRTPRAQVLQQLLSRRAGAREVLTIEETAIELADEVLRFSRPDPAPPRRLSSRCEEAVETAKALLSTRLGEPMGLEKLMARVRCSPFYLMRTFRRATGLSLRQYRMRARLYGAVERLLARDSDLGQIGVELGFSDHSHFTSAFRRTFGFTPSSFRETAPRAPVREILKRRA